MRRRGFLIALAAATSLPRLVRAQNLGRRARIAILVTGTAQATHGLRKSFQFGLSEHGYLEGDHYTIETRFADGAVARLPALATELIQGNPDVLLTTSTASTLAARDGTTTIPIVSALMGNAVGVGLIASLARPGGNVTGIVITDEELAAKQVDLARELVPATARIGVLINSSNPGTGVQRKGAEMVSAARSLALSMVDAQTPAAIVPAFRQLQEAGASFVFVIGDALFFSERQQIATAALSVKLPTMFIHRDHVTAGGLMSYGVDLNENYRRVASHVVRILRGARPGDIPAERPVKFELALNQRTAKALGIVVPPNLLALADEVIE